MPEIRSMEVLAYPGTHARGQAVLAATATAALRDKLEVATTKSYGGRKDVLVLYGRSKLQHHFAVREQLNAGRCALIWDRGYWGRDEIDPFYRLEIRRARLKLFAEESPVREHPSLEEVSDASGFVLLCSSLPKSGRNSRKIAAVEKQLADIRQAFPDREIRYRPKVGRTISYVSGLSDLTLADKGDIKSAMTGAALVVAQGSNVGIDAIVYGVPAVVKGGIASLFWPSVINQDALRLPSREQRAAFLSRVAWFNWRASEMPIAWAFFKRLLEGDGGSIGA